MVGLSMIGTRSLAILGETLYQLKYGIVIQHHCFFMMTRIRPTPPLRSTVTDGTIYIPVHITFVSV